MSKAKQNYSKSHIQVPSDTLLLVFLQFPVRLWKTQSHFDKNSLSILVAWQYSVYPEEHADRWTTKS